MNKPVRNLKVVRAVSVKHMPYLPLKGRWLERAGFSVGMRVDVLVKEQCLIVLPSNSSGTKMP